MSEAVGIAAGDANPERGEHEITLAGVTYLLRPSHAAALKIEAKTEHSLVELFREANAGKLRLRNAATVVAELMKAGAADVMTKNVSDDRVSELIYEEGLPHVLAVLTIVLLDMSTGGRTASGEAKAVTAIDEGAGAA